MSAALPWVLRLTLPTLALVLGGCAEDVQGDGLDVRSCSSAHCKAAHGSDSASTDGNAGVAKPVTPAKGPAATPIPLGPATPAPTTAASSPALAPAAPPPATRGIARKYLNGDHLFTREASEAPDWSFEGIAFLVFDEPLAGTQPIFRCVAGTQHFVSLDENCEGQAQDGGALGWLSSSAASGGVELLRCRNATGSDHLITSRQECDQAGFVIEGTMGFAPLQ